jgi:hypothetical protein
MHGIIITGILWGKKPQIQEKSCKKSIKILDQICHFHYIGCNINPKCIFRKLFCNVRSFLMKKVIFILIAFLVISGAVWGQTPRAIPEFDAVRTLSTENRYSAGTFTSDVDDYISVTDHDPKIGTFFFLGGFPDNGANVTTTDPDFVGPNPRYALNFGLGKTFNSLYLGVYYGGNFVNASGNYDGDETKESEATWRNRLAVLVNPTGKGIGAFRFDLIMDDTTSETVTVDGDVYTQDTAGAPAIAFTWGGMKFGALSPYVMLGFKFADRTVTGGGTPTERIEDSGAWLAIGGGIVYELNENADLSADLAYAHGFASSVKGENIDSFTSGGSDVFALGVGYSQKIDLGKVTVGLKPNMVLFFQSDSNNTSAPGVDDDPSDDFFVLAAGVDLGVKYQHNKLIALYTGASLQIFNWSTYGHSGGEDKNDATSWVFQGFRWDPRYTPNGNHLGFGLTVTPTEGLVIGAGLNTLLDKLFVIDLQRMQVRSGTFFNNSGANNIGDWATNIARNLTFDLTVSYKM